LETKLVEIRQAALSDSEAVAELAGQLGYSTSPEEARARLAAVFEDEDQAAYAAEAAGGGVVGWIHVFGTRRLVAEPFAELGGLIVDESHRASGIGGALLETAEAWARDQGHCFLRIRSNTARTGAQAFYGALGYGSIQTQYVFDKELGRAPL
jgi:GNAT superfamily N-acetyltransferase